MDPSKGGDKRKRDDEPHMTSLLLPSLLTQPKVWCGVSWE